MGNTFKGGRDQPHRKTPILVGTKEMPILSVQCFEQRHSECPGKGWGPLVGEINCECKCHGKAIPKGVNKDE